MLHLFLSFSHILPGLEAIELFSCSTQLSMKFPPLINAKMPTIIGILTIRGCKKCILGLSKPENADFYILLMSD